MPYPSQLASPEGRRLVEALRRATKGLSGATEAIDGFGHTTFRVGKKSFVLAGTGESGTVVTIRSDLVTQDALVRRGPYYRARYIGQHGWISIDDPLSHDWDEVSELIADAYRLAAPKRVKKSPTTARATTPEGRKRARKTEPDAPDRRAQKRRRKA